MIKQMINKAVVEKRDSSAAKRGFTEAASVSAPRLVVIKGGAQEPLTGQITEAQVRKLYYVHSIIPAQNSDIGPDGACNFKMLCFEMPQNITPGQARIHRFDKGDAVVLDYRGFISRHKGEVGMVAGHVYAFEGGRPIGGVMMPAPRYQAQSRYEDVTGSVGGYDAEIAITKEIAARRYPARKKTIKHNICGG